MFRIYTLFLVLFSPFSLRANSNAQPLPSLSFLEKAGIQIINANIKQIPQTAAVTAIAALATYGVSCKTTKNPLIKAVASLGAGILSYAFYDHYAGYRGVFVPGTLFNTHPYRLVRDWNKYLKMNASEKNALLDQPYPAFLEKLYTSAEFHDHPIRESNKLVWLEQELKEVAKMNTIQQK